MINKTYWLVRAWRGEQCATEQFLSLDDAIGWATAQARAGAAVDLYEARQVAFSVEPSVPCYRIRAEVWGGVTGYRDGWLKTNGAVAVFSDRAAAEAEAKRQTEQMNASPFRSASFGYTVVEA